MGRSAAIESLESRRLMTLNPFGSTAPVPLGTRGFGSPQNVSSGVAADGSYVVGATLSDGQGGQQIAVTRFAANGEPLGAPVELDRINYLQSDIDTRLQLSDLATNAAGDSVIAYNHATSKAPFSAEYVVRLSHDGTASTPQQLLDNSGPVGNESHVAIDASGNYYICYRTGQFDNETLHVASFDVAGKSRGDPVTIPILGTDSGWGRSGFIAARPDGSGVIFSATEIQEFNDDFLVDFAYGVTSLTGVISSKTVTEHSIYGGPIVVAKDGSFTISYEQIDDNFVSLREQERNSFIQRYDASGSAIGEPVEIAGDSRAETVLVMDLSSDTNGGYFAKVITTHLSRQALYLLPLNRALAANGPAIEIDTGNKGSELTFSSGPIPSGHSLGVDSNGAVVLSYDKRGTPADNGYVRHFTPQIAAVGGTTLYVFGTAASDSPILVDHIASSTSARVGSTVRHFNASTIDELSIEGVAGNDAISNLTSLRSTIRGGDGNDTISGGQNADYILGGNGNDRVTGNAGNDTIYGQDGADYLFGNPDNDRLIGGSGADTLAGGAGNDRADDDPLDRRSGIEVL